MRVTEDRSEKGRSLSFKAEAAAWQRRRAGRTRSIAGDIPVVRFRSARRLDTVVSPKSKLTKPTRMPKATWVEPQFYAEVEHRDITSEGLLRASSFKGLSRK
ncbi:hypothetical protein [Bradyrhizobium genosp. L]|uniref:ATP dependent DNA ligase n=1 Tax=Bradyrhizobium genosp. L TaxID=83637 RepID=UPI001FED52AD|nr:hypothetical protein [Bradyrhizobium genosp. L]